MGEGSGVGLYPDGLSQLAFVSKGNCAVIKGVMMGQLTQSRLTALDRRSYRGSKGRMGEVFMI